VTYRALIVEDDHALADVLRMRLGRDGHKVTIATHQRQAYHLLDKNVFDFVLLDLRLPTDESDLDPNAEVGFAILDHIRDRFSQDELPVVVMTAYEETSQTAVRALKAGANDYIQKPFEDSPVSLDEKLAGIVRHLEQDKKSPTDKCHRIVFKRDCVEINGIRMTGRIHGLLLLLLSRSFSASPDASDQWVATMRGGEIARTLDITEQAARQCVSRFRKKIAAEHKRLEKGAIGKQDIIRNTRDWNGYELNLDMAYITRE